MLYLDGGLEGGLHVLAGDAGLTNDRLSAAFDPVDRRRLLVRAHVTRNRHEFHLGEHLRGWVWGRPEESREREKEPESEREQEGERVGGETGKHDNILSEAAEPRAPTEQGVCCDSRSMHAPWLNPRVKTEVRVITFMEVLFYAWKRVLSTKHTHREREKAINPLGLGGC